MFTTLKLALMTALMSTGMEMATPSATQCIFEYDRIMPRVTTDLNEHQKEMIRIHLKPMEGKPCHEIALWASKAIDALPVAMVMEQKDKKKKEGK